MDPQQIIQSLQLVPVVTRNRIRARTRGAYFHAIFGRSLRSTLFFSLQALVLERKAKFEDRIHEVRVEDASHVRIMLRYPDQYIAALEGVLDWGVAEWRRKQGTEEKDDKLKEEEKDPPSKL